MDVGLHCFFLWIYALFFSPKLKENVLLNEDVAYKSGEQQYCTHFITMVITIHIEVMYAVQKKEADKEISITPWCNVMLLKSHFFNTI